MNNKEKKENMISQLNRIEVLENMLSENVLNFDENKLYMKDFNCTKSSILSQIVILRNELLSLSKQIKTIW